MSLARNQRALYLRSSIVWFRYDPSAEILDYATTKAAIVGFTKGLADKLLEKGIRVNCVAVNRSVDDDSEQQPSPSRVAWPGLDSASHCIVQQGEER